MPDKPNRVILDYTIYKSLLNQPFTSLATVPASSPYIYNDSNVEPYTQYQYYIEATNSAGSTSGDPGTVTTAEAGKLLYYVPITTIVLIYDPRIERYSQLFYIMLALSLLLSS